jgi:6-phosphofructokinase
MPDKLVGILTSEGDCPGLNAAIRAVGKAAHSYGIRIVGFLDGFRGLVENRFIHLEMSRLSGILTQGGTILGTSRAQFLDEGRYGILVAVKRDKCVPVDPRAVAGQLKRVPPDHPWVTSARLVGTCLGD